MEYLLLDNCGQIIHETDDLAEMEEYRSDWVEYVCEEWNSTYQNEDFPIYKRIAI